jgi:hypothetical protein
MFGTKHQIVYLPAIPREKKALQSLIHLARHRQKRTNMVNFAAGNIVAWGFYILFVWGPARHAGAAVTVAVDQAAVYLPLVVR